MTTVQIVVNVSSEDLERIAREQLGLIAQSEATRRAASVLVASDFHPRSEAVNAAINHVIRATEKFDQDQYTNGEASAATALFEAGKRLRKAMAGEQSAKSQKGVFHV